MTQSSGSPFRRQSQFLRHAAIAVLTGAAAAVLPAQTTASSPSPDNSDEPVLLSPFVVNTSQDKGYAATSTLAGTRTNAQLKDLANPLDVFTPDLIKDLDIHDIQDFTNFANDVEPNAAGDLNSDGQEREVWNYNYMQIRGFKTGNVTRNFMALNAQFEAYNSERIELSKGPNSIIAGIGDPGGSVNFITKVPILNRSKDSITYRTDDLGSQRVSLDANQVLIKDVLGLRLNALWEDKEYYRQPAYDQQKAWHLTGQWRPTSKTTINLGYEKRRTDRASPRGVFPLDYVSAWLNAGSALATGVPSNNNVTVNGAKVTAASVGMATINSDTWVLDSDGHIRNTKGTVRGAQTFATGAINTDTFASNLNFPADRWIGGPNGINFSDWGITEISLTQAINDDFNIELSYGYSDNHVRQGNSVSRNLYVDTGSFGTNTHPSELYAETRPFWIDRQFNIADYRASASYNVHPSRYNKWLGEHQIAAVYEYNHRDEWQNNGRLSLVQKPTGPVAGAQNTAFWIRDYLNPAAGVTSQRDLRSLYFSEGIDQDGYVARFVPTEGYAFYNWLVEQSTVLGVLQSRWFNDHLITTIGLRRDHLARYVASTYQDPVTKLWHAGTIDAPAGDHPSSAPFIDRPTVDIGVSRNYGAVWHVTNWLSLTGNYSTNVAPGAESRQLNGDYLPQSSGVSHDYGVRLSLLNNRLNLNLVHFETSQKNAPTQNTAISSPSDQLQAIEAMLFNNGITSTDRLGASSGDYTIADRKAKGEELTVTGNLTDNWTFRLSGSRLENVLTNIAPDVVAYANANRAFYEKQDPSLTTSGSTTTLGTYIGQVKDSLSLMASREGNVTFPASEYNLRFSTKYSFDHPTRLKGFAIGGTVRWASAPVIGYYRTTNPAGSVYYDSSRVAEGDDPVYVDLLLSYQRRIFHNLNWSLQLNVSNLFGNEDPTPNAAVNSSDSANYTWIRRAYRPVDGRIFSLTSTISF